MNEGNIRVLCAGIFFACVAAVVAAFCVVRPTWGFMDDAQNRVLAAAASDSPFFVAVKERVAFDASEYGRIRPLYQVWILTVYRAFHDTPLLAYLFVILFVACGMYAWGSATRAVRPEMGAWAQWCLPLSFIVFTPFWNTVSYISTQEKFVTVFSGLAVWAWYSWFLRGGKMLLALGALCGLLALMGKETAVSLWAAMGLASVFAAAVATKRRAAFAWAGLACLIIAAVYVIAVKAQVHGYSAQYSLAGPSFADRLREMPLAVKAVIVLCGIATTISAVRSLRKREFDPAIVFPLTAGAYCAVLFPWGYPNYLLAPIAAPFVCAGAVCVFDISAKSPLFVRRACVIMATVVSIVVGYGVVSEDLRKKADTKALVTFLSSPSAPVGEIFFPLPDEEASCALAVFSGRSVSYVREDRLESERISETGALLVVYKDMLPLNLVGVIAGEKVFDSRVWDVVRVVRGEGHSTIVNGCVGSFLERIKQRFRS